MEAPGGRSFPDWLSGGFAYLWPDMFNGERLVLDKAA
jgi:hypothetical protein